LDPKVHYSNDERRFKMEISKSTIYGLGIFILIVVGGFYMIQGGSSQDISNLAAEKGTGEIQKVVIGIKDYNYYPQTVKVKSGQPVSISLDDSVYGCFRDFTIRDLGVKKYLRTSSDSVEFTPTKPGTYTFACSMGMGLGKLVVS
jgi:plastocyanin domain-containing protein